MAEKKSEEVLDKKTVEKIRKDVLEEFDDKYKEELVKKIADEVSEEVNKKLDREYRLKIIDDVTTDVKDEIKNQIYREEKKIGFSKSFKIFRLSLYILILLAACGYTAYRLYKTDNFELLKFNYEPKEKVDNPVKGEDNKEKEAAKDPEPEVKPDYKELYGGLLNEFKIYDYSLYKKSTKASDMTKVQRLQMAYSTLTDDDMTIDGTIISIKSSTMREAYVKLFGKDDYEAESFNIYNLNFVYSLAKNEYIGIMYENNTEDVVYELIDANVDDDYIMLKAYVAKVSDGRIYNIKTNREIGNTSHKISEYANKVNVVTFRFTKDKAFYSVTGE